METLSLDALFLISTFLEYRDIAALSTTNNTANNAMQRSVVWEHQCKTYFDPRINKNRPITFKQHFQSFIERYGVSAPLYFRRTMRAWRMIRVFATQYIPDLLATFNPPASSQEIHDLTHKIATPCMLKARNYTHLTPYLIFLGHCANGQVKRDAEQPSNAKLGMYGYYQFYNKVSCAFLLSSYQAAMLTSRVLSVQQICSTSNDVPADAADLWMFAGAVRGLCSALTVPCFTFFRKSDGKIIKLSRDSYVIEPKHGGTNSFLQHLEFYVANLLNNNYRVDAKLGILRFPLRDKATSECVTKGVAVRASPLFVAEMTHLRRNDQVQYMFPYHIEIECPVSSDSDVQMQKRCVECCDEVHTLHERHWRIQDGGGALRRTDGPGLIGMHPRVQVDEPLFMYESCSPVHTRRGSEMWGSFSFKKRLTDEQDAFELTVEAYKLDVDLCQFI